MFSAYLLIYFLTTMIPEYQTHSVEYSRYECGAHGKFEYCIDGIPGCVIGCHCHPGYYFDTDTKICEPNIKLTENFRRRYMTESTRVYPVNTPTIENIPTPTPTNVLDVVTKDTDDLGDWLYNQFFKTIEAQVMNFTNDKQPTRRSENIFRSDGGGGGDLEDTHGGRKSNYYNKGKTRKILKKRGKKRKSKARGLRRKLLRITEDDSLFDSESDSDDNYSDSGNSDSSSSSSSSGEISREHSKNHTDDREHGHKKVVIFNKRPRPPLPSFIILPSMDTPYYPPIALPPPPPMPMYPMVPIPPMAPCIPFLENGSVDVTTTTKPKVSPDDDSRPTTLSTTTQTTTNSNGSIEDPPVSVLRRTPQKPSKNKVQKPVEVKSSEDTFLLRSTDSKNQINGEHVERQKLVHKLITMLRAKHKAPSVLHSNMDEEDENTPLLRNIQSVLDPSIETFNHEIEKERNVKLKDFKYLSDLIHRVNLSNINLPTASQRDLANTRKRYDLKPNEFQESIIQRNSTTQNLEDTYYMNLGRQIASLVRTPESKLDNVNIAKDRSVQGDSIISVLNENRYPSRSYWERFVRSPLSKLKDYIAESNYLRNDNNEYNLMNLENEVSSFASTVPPMSLQELENILSTLQKHRTEMLYNQNIVKESVDVKLISARPTEVNKSYKIFSVPQSYGQSIPLRKSFGNINDLKQEAFNRNETQYSKSPKLNLRVIHDWQFQQQDLTPMINLNQQISYQKPATVSTTNVTLNDVNRNHYSKLIKEPYPDLSISQNTSKISHEEFFIFPNGGSELKYITPKPENPELLQKDLEIPVRRRWSFVKFTDLFEKHSKPTKKYLEWAAKYHELGANNAELSTKYPVLGVKYHELPRKHPEVSPGYPQMLHKLHDSSDKYDDFSINPDDTKYPEKSTNNIESLRKHYDLPDLFLKPNSSTIISEMSPKTPVGSSKYPESSTNFTEHSRRYLKQNTNFSSNPAIFDYKKFNYLSRFGGNRQYMHEAAYPLRIPSYRQTLSKHFESPSYFQHELHHFDYFD